MSASVFDIETAPVEQAEAVATRWGGVGKELKNQAKQARAHARWTEAEEWLGAAAEAASHRVDATVNRADAMGLSAQGIGLAGGAHVRMLGIARTVVSAALKAARAAQMSVDSSGHVSPRSIGGTGFGEGVAMALSAVLRSAVTMVSAMDTHTGHTVRALSSGAGAGMEIETAPPGSPPGTPLATGPDQSTLRDQPPPSTQVSLEDLADVSVTKLETPSGPVYVAGDVDSAESITTFVSGVGSSAEGPQKMTSAWAAQQVAEAKAQGRNIAVIAWHGYAAPTQVASAITKEPARQGATSLRTFQQELRERNPDATLHVTGFSYGSVVVGEAAGEGSPGLEADSVDFIGSPGVGSEHAQDLQLMNHGERLAEPEVNSHHVPGDLIQLATEAGFGVHGPDPSSPGFGAANAPESWSSYHWQRMLDLYILGRGDTNTHSSYPWDPGVRISR